MARGKWTYVGVRSGGKLSSADKLFVSAACQRLIDDVLLPRYLLAIEATEFNYPVHISGKWLGVNYRFITRYRSGFADNLGEEFDAPFARIGCMSRDRVDLSYHRHTGQWFRLFGPIKLAEALELIADGGHFAPC